MSIFKYALKEGNKPTMARYMSAVHNSLILQTTLHLQTAFAQTPELRKVSLRLCGVRVLLSDARSCCQKKVRART